MMINNTSKFNIGDRVVYNRAYLVLGDLSDLKIMPIAGTICAIEGNNIEYSIKTNNPMFDVIKHIHERDLD